MAVKNIIETEIEFLKGVGPARADLLKKELGVFTFADLLNYFPFRYIDRSLMTKVSDIEIDSGIVQLSGYFFGAEIVGKGKASRLQISFTDKSASISVVWFKSHKWVLDKINPQTKFVIFGKVNMFNNRLYIPHPELMTIDEFKAMPYSGKMQAVYNTTEKLKSRGLDSKGIAKLTAQALLMCSNHIKETLPEYLLEKLKLPSISDSYKNVHVPHDSVVLDRSLKRFRFEEALLLQLRHKINIKNRHNTPSGVVLKNVGGKFNYFYHKNLSFQLTNAQKRVMHEIHEDIASGFQMNRLLQGDVGSGKTVVALMSMLLAVDNGYQACMMAPTEILAQQHYYTISNLLKNIDVQIHLLTGSTKAKDRKEMLKNLISGETHIIVGTHALIEDTVVFQKLGLAVIDEQHRFGVKQRAKLQTKSNDLVHVLVMTATPIPRTLALSVYGDLDVSVIDEMPPGRKAVKTMFFTDDYRNQVISLMKKQLTQKRQIYIVYPLINESEKLDLLALESGYESVIRDFPMPMFEVGILHGRIHQNDKKTVMSRFKRGICDILVSTTVIEVGVDVSNASMMIIENAERFGLAQLHQLRGRVGRGAEQSYCILMGGNNVSAEGKSRIDALVSSNDGFKIAEHDMKMRGPGDILGTRQSGELDFKWLDLIRDFKIINYARSLAGEIIEKDSELSSKQNTNLRDALKNYGGKNSFLNTA